MKYRPNDATRDLNTGLAPTYSKMRSLISASQIRDGSAINTTPLTSLITTVAAQMAADGDSLNQAVSNAQQIVSRELLNGNLGDIDVFTAPVLVDGVAGNNQTILQHRIAVEGLAAILEKVATAENIPAGGVHGVGSHRFDRWRSQWCTFW